MRKVVFILVLVLLTGSISFINAQDVIIKADGSEIRAKVTEVGPNYSYFKYKLNNQGVLSDRDYELKKHEVFKIQYEDKSVWVNPEFGTSPPPPPPPSPPIPQQDYRKGYVGVGIGGSFLLEDYNLKNGMQFTINAGYRFGKNIGITGSFLFTSYELTQLDDASLGLIGFVAGPMFSFPTTSKKVEFDLRPTIGYVSLQAQYGDDSDTDDSALAIVLGGSARWNVSRVIAITGNVDYIHHFEFEDFDIDLSSVGISIGVNFRF
jgi:hypothetical protein